MYLFISISGVIYGRLIVLRCKLICELILRTVRDSSEGRDLNGETVSSW